MAGFAISFDSSTGDFSVGPIPPANREHKGKSLLSLPQDYVVIDLETTGLDPRFDEIIEIAGIKYSAGVEVARFESFVKPESKLPEFITELTGITDDMLRDAPPIERVLPDFLSFIGDTIVVGHNVNFDINFIYDFSQYLKLSPFCNDFVDTMRLCRRLYKDMENHKLHTLMTYLHIESSAQHRAMADCENTQACFVKMRERISEIGGIPESATEAWSHLSKTITAETTDFNPDSPIFGHSFAFTGKLEQKTRKEAMQAVVNAGGICCDGVIATTNYLVLGNTDYCQSIKGGKSNKQKKAEKMQLNGADIAVISEAVFLDMLHFEG